MGYMIRYAKRGKHQWSSVMDGDQVRCFPTEYLAHSFKEKLEDQYGRTHTYNVYDYDGSAL